MASRGGSCDATALPMKAGGGLSWLDKSIFSSLLNSQAFAPDQDGVICPSAHGQVTDRGRVTPCLINVYEGPSSFKPSGHWSVGRWQSVLFGGSLEDAEVGFRRHGRQVFARLPDSLAEIGFANDVIPAENGWCAVA